MNELNDEITLETDEPESTIGRSAFLVETVAAGVSVRTVFVGQDQRVIELPAVFPELGYALAQIDELKRVVVQHFAHAAQVGAQVIAAQAAHAQSGDAQAVELAADNAAAEAQADASVTAY